METEVISRNNLHHGRNVKNLREMLGVKQEILAKNIGFTQQYISILEAQERIDDDLLAKIANALHIPVDVIKNFDEEKAINIVSSTFHDAAVGSDVTQYNKCTFNPLDKVIELCEQNAELYKKLLYEKDEQIKLLTQLLK
jgi:transcriptional regulator with XRE-family HTH domain